MASSVASNIASKKNVIDNYTVDVLQTQYNLHKNYVTGRIASLKGLGIKARLPSIPEDITENIIKFIIHKNGDTSSSWNCKGDLYSTKEGVQECKCFTSDGPLSFSPTSDWNVIYFMDAQHWLEDKFVVYRINLKKSSEEWKKIKVNGLQTFDDQAKQGRRPHISWKLLEPQVSSHCEKIFDGTFQEIITPAPQ